MNPSLLHSFRLSVAERHLGVYGVVVRQRGEVVAAHRWRYDDIVCLYSASKTFSSLGVGIARDEGLLKLDDTVLSYFPALRSVATEGSDAITLRDLLHMSSGKHAFWFTADEQTMRDTDWAELFFREPLSSKPGTRHFYSNACTYMLGRVVEVCAGQTLRDYLVPRLFEPLGIHNPQWHTCPGGHTLAATELYLKTEELSRLGELLLQKGVYAGQRVVSEAYVEQLAGDTVDTRTFPSADPEYLQGYGYQVWLCSPHGVYRADGKYGQYAVVVPDREAVVTVTSHNEQNPGDILRAIYTDILPLL